MNPLLFVTIYGNLYRVDRIDPKEYGVAVAWRFTKPLENESYVVSYGGSGPNCDCADFVFRNKGMSNFCKHFSAALNLGLLCPWLKPEEFEYEESMEDDREVDR